MKTYQKFVLALMTIFVICRPASAQDDLLAELDSAQDKEFTTATFKGTRLINFHTLETVGFRTLDFRISHRFGFVNGGAYEFFGLDGSAAIRLGLEYSYDGRLMAGLGRTSTQKLYDGFLKYKLLRQVKGDMPLTFTLFVSTNITAEKDPQKDIVGVDRYKYFSSRMSYVFQGMVGRKFSDRFSFQLSPTMVHYNLVDQTTDKNDMYALIGLARLKLSTRAALTGEYAWRAVPYISDMKTFHDCVSLGVDIETGGHVFQVFVTNAYGINEVQTIPYTTGNILKGDLRIGFNISRVFTL